ncbi:MAG TPA: hypothetical protein VHU87_00150 [Rhizomicrobium sp.]|jgi:hypothetical protein|nr:hypothetical protein [Rhizomicrobium sp.]
MHGSLDSPPIVISTSRAKAACFLLVSLAFLVAGFFGLHWSSENWWAWMFVVVFAGCVAAYVALLVSPNRLVFAPAGVTWTTQLRTRRYAWAQIRDIELVNLPLLYAPPFPSPRQTFFNIVREDGRIVPGGFGGLWEISAPELCDLTRQAQARWAGDKT